MKKPLIVYYSWSCGNTERTAKALQNVAGGDLVRLDTAVPYTGSYNDVVDQGQREVNAGGYMGLIRTYSVKATLGSQEKTYDVSWILKAEVRKFSTYVEDISSITVEVPNIDF